jgi:Heterokaryon incompatibility protein (HET)
VAPPGDHRPLTDNISEAIYQEFESSGITKENHSFITVLKDDRRPPNQPVESREVPDMINFDLIKGWLSHCQKTHDGCRLLIGETKKSFFRKYIKKGHLDRIKGTESQKFKHNELFKLIDVTARRVVFAKPHTEYATLSYVWGQTQQFRMTKNLAIWQEDRKERFITLPEHLPRTIEDAMLVVQRLGYQYLWIDAVCIVQDDKDEVNTQIPEMNDIYSNATFCIVALSGSHADAGLSGVRQPRESSRIQAKVKIGDLTLGQTLPPPHREFHHSTHSKRAWTYQETTLSKRCLIFAENEVYFSCSKAFYRESVMEAHKLTNANLQYFHVCDPLPNFQHEILEMKSNDFYRLDWYAEHVSKYTERSLTYQEDILNAFAGLTTLFGRKLPMQMYYGTPVGVEPWGKMSMIGITLAWQSTHLGPKDIRRTKEQSGTPYLPSWCWASWQCNVSYCFERDDLEDTEMHLVDEKSLKSLATPASLKHEELSSSAYVEDRHLFNPSFATILPPGFLCVTTRVAAFKLGEIVAPALPTDILDKNNQKVGFAHIHTTEGIFRRPADGTFFFAALFRGKEKEMGGMCGFQLLLPNNNQGWVAGLILVGGLPYVEEDTPPMYRFGIGSIGKKEWENACPEQCTFFLG